MLKTILPSLLRAVKCLLVANRSACPAKVFSTETRLAHFFKCFVYSYFQAVLDLLIMYCNISVNHSDVVTCKIIHEKFLEVFRVSHVTTTTSIAEEFLTHAD